MMASTVAPNNVMDEAYGGDTNHLPCVKGLAPPNALMLLRNAMYTFEPWVNEQGHLSDPVLGEPTQYGTAYYSWCAAVLAANSVDQERQHWINRASAAAAAALAQVLDDTQKPLISWVDPTTGSAERSNHRDFAWPAILKTWLCLRELSPVHADALAAGIASASVPDCFLSRPPSNWSSVWLLGEWLRISRGQGGMAMDEFETYLGDMLAAVNIKDGVFCEAGNPNAYDLFVRVHLLELLASNYHGKHHHALATLENTGLCRSLALQMSDGSLASGHRSAGQSWTLGAQVLLFQLATRDEACVGQKMRQHAGIAASRSLLCLAGCQRASGTFSPVINTLPANQRVGYEPYTMDSTYPLLALGFLATAIDRGYDGQFRMVVPYQGDVFLDQEIGRATARLGSLSVSFLGDADHKYDAFGLADMTFGAGRILQWASSVQFNGYGDGPLNLGIAMREGGRLGSIRPLSSRRWQLISMRQSDEQSSSAKQGSDIGWHISAAGTPVGEVSNDAIIYEISCSLHEQYGVMIEESTPGRTGALTLLVPYLWDAGSGHQTVIEVTSDDSSTQVRLTHGDEVILGQIDAPLLGQLDLTAGGQNRRGRCGLLRLDLQGERSTLRHCWRVLR